MPGFLVIFSPDLLRTKSPTCTYQLQISRTVRTVICATFAVPPFYNFEFMIAGDFPHDYSKPATPIVMMGGGPILYKITNLHAYSIAWELCYVKKNICELCQGLVTYEYLDDPATRQ